MSLLETDRLTVFYGKPGKTAAPAVSEVSVRVEKGETIGLVGESGCGKTTTGLAMLALVPVHSGRVMFAGSDVASLKGGALKRFRRRAQMIFQDPYGSLNPRMSVGAAIEEPLMVHGVGTAAERRDRVREMLERVGLEPAHARRYPHEFSGGQRQRIGIARALMLEPDLLIADEPVSALDVSVQVQVLNLLKDLRDSMGLALVFIAHDLAVVRYMCSRIYVMYAGRVVESAPAADFFANPLHPYSRVLLASVPDIEKQLEAGAAGRAPIKGEAGGAAVLSAGCPFQPRCPKAGPRCETEAPVLREAGGNRAVACLMAL